ncbi:ketoacyl-synthetase C-terminal extension domain-containing protein, partial [Streptomyces sp. NPDC050759]|uniref:ketoacyl-synthetase C-terminal extension domain-containing protein n=1 Tax=Streptomyces sp. NPDC050759 TaxID=3365635 RepID=UPI0037B00DE0
VMALRAGVLPRTLHVDEPSRHVDWSAGAVRLLEEQRPWPRTGRPRRAAVSGFGISGTNAHLILEEAPADEGSPDGKEVPAQSSGVLPWVVCGSSAAGLRAQAARLAEFAAEQEADPRAVAAALVGSRAMLRHRAVVWGTRRDDLVRGLESVASGQPTPNVVVGNARSGKTALLFSGAHADLGIVRRLCDAYPAFSAAYEEITELLTDRSGEALEQISAAAVSFACEMALCALLESLGVAPDHLIADRDGEVSAAYAAGAISLPDACTLWAARAESAPEEDDHSRPAPPAVEPIEYDEERCPVISVVTGRPLDLRTLASSAADEGGAESEDSLRTAVLDAQRKGCTRFLEVGPPSRMTPVVADCVAADRKAAAAVLLDSASTAAPPVLGVLADLFVRGLPVRWQQAAAHSPRELRETAVRLPTYAFQRKRFWLDGPGTGAAPAEPLPEAHTLLGRPIVLADPNQRWFEGTWSPPADIAGEPAAVQPLPLAALLEWALAAANTATAHPSGTAWELRGVDLSAPHQLDADGAITTQTVVVEPAGSPELRCYVRSGKPGPEPWHQQIAVASLSPAPRTERHVGRPADRLAGMTEVPPREGGALTRAGIKGEEALAQLAGPSAPGRWLDPRALDDMLGLLAGELGTTPTPGGSRMPATAESIRLLGDMPAAALWFHAVRRSSSRRQAVIDLQVVSDEGVLLAEMEGLAFGDRTGRADGAPTGEREASNVTSRSEVS